MTLRTLLIIMLTISLFAALACVIPGDIGVRYDPGEKQPEPQHLKPAQIVLWMLKAAACVAAWYLGLELIYAYW